MKNTIAEDLPWIPKELVDCLGHLPMLIQDEFYTDVVEIRLYGSWQKQSATVDSDVDVAVLLNRSLRWQPGESSLWRQWFTRWDSWQWRRTERKINALLMNGRWYSITVATPQILDHYLTFGPIHLRNWALAVLDGYVIWRRQGYPGLTL